MNIHEHPLYDNRIGEPCERCDSLETFDTFDHKRVCRNCGFVETLESRPVNLITKNLVWQHERAEKAKRKVEAEMTAIDLQEMVKQIFNI